MVGSMPPASAGADPSSLSQPEEWRWQHRWVHRRDILRELVARDIKLRYKGSILGQAWTLVNPLAELMVLFFVFSTVIPVNNPNYASSLFTGLLVYGWFQTSLFNATGAVVNNREMIRRPGIPASILPVVSVASTLLHFVLALPILFTVLLISGISISRFALLLPALIAVQFTLILSFAYPLAALYVWFRDTPHLLRVVLHLLFYLTPVFYEASNIPARYQTLYRLNPMVPVVEGYRDVLLRGQAPALGPLVTVGVVAVAVLVVGFAVFRHTSRYFPDEL